MPTRRSRARAAPRGEPLDLLFIDGDHSYDGVRADFELYGRLVRPGGLIALHDVNEDFRTRRGVETPVDLRRGAALLARAEAVATRRRS